MRVRLLLQVGAYHKEPENPDADFLKLLSNKEELLKWTQSLDYNFKVKQEHKMIDGTPFLIEYEAVVDVPLVTPKEVV